MNPKQTGFNSVLGSLIAIFAMTSFGCSGDQNGLSRTPASQAKAKLSGTQVSAVSNCTEQVARFDSTQNLEPIEAAQLPQGFLLYSSAEVLIQSKSKPETHMVAREVRSGKGVKTGVSCANQLVGETISLDANIKGLTKIEILSSEQTRVTARQFQMYMNERARGMVSLNPRSQVRPMKTLADYLTYAGPKTRIFKAADGKYVLQVEREDGDARIELLVTYDHVERR